MGHILAPSDMPSLSSAMASFIHRLPQQALPVDIEERARVCLLNGYGIALGCLTTPYAPVAAQAALAMDGEQPDGATLLADGRRTSVAGAAWANSALFHGRAQEDTCGAAHLGAILVPMLTALVERRNKDAASRLLPSLVAGYEVGGLLEQAYAGLTTPAGLRSSPLYGTIAAAAATSVLLELSIEQTAAALSNAASFTGGMLQSFVDGTDEWRYQLGIAARTGWAATELARAGSVAAPNAFEGSSGFVQTYARTACDVSELVSRLGEDWSIRRVTFKPFPVCAFNQTPVHAGLALRERLASRRIVAARVRMNPNEAGYAGLNSTGPFTSISTTLMSTPFCVAATLLRGAFTMAQLTAYDDLEVHGLAQRIQLQADADVSRLSCVLEVYLEDGQTLRHSQRMTTADYAYDRAGVRSLVRSVGAESALPAPVFERVEMAVDDPERNFAEVFNAFELARHVVKEGRQCAF